MRRIGARTCGSKTSCMYVCLAAPRPLVSSRRRTPREIRTAWCALRAAARPRSGITTDSDHSSTTGRDGRTTSEWRARDCPPPPGAESRNCRRHTSTSGYPSSGGPRRRRPGAAGGTRLTLGADGRAKAPSPLVSPRAFRAGCFRVAGVWGWAEMEGPRGRAEWTGADAWKVLGAGWKKGGVGQVVGRDPMGR